MNTMQTILLGAGKLTRCKIIKDTVAELNKSIVKLDEMEDKSKQCVYNNDTIKRRRHNWMHFAHRPECTVTLNSN